MSGPDALLRALDHTPTTVEALSRALERPAVEVEVLLREAEASGLAVCWGDLWATTWRAKWVLAPMFFRRWVPTSVAVGAVVALLALTFNTDMPSRATSLGLFAVVLAAAVVGMLPLKVRTKP